MHVERAESLLPAMGLKVGFCVIFDSQNVHLSVHIMNSKKCLNDIYYVLWAHCSVDHAVT